MACNECCRNCLNYFGGECLAEYYDSNLDMSVVDYYDITENGYLDECIRESVDVAGFEDIGRKIDAVLAGFRIGQERRNDIEGELVCLLTERIKNKLIEVLNDNLDEMLHNHIMKAPEIHMEINNPYEHHCKEYR